MKLCVIGCGSHSTFAHGPSYRKYAALHRDADLAACCDLSPKAAARYAEAFGFARTYTDFEEMLEKERPDMAGIVVPEAATCGVAAAVLKRRVPCLAEKPPALTRRDALSLLQTAEETRTPFRVAFNRRFMPLVRRTLALLAQAGEPVQYIHYAMHRVGRDDADFSATAIHGIDLVRCLAGAAYDRLHCAYVPVENAGKRGDNIFLSGQMTGGAQVRLDFLPLTGWQAERAELLTDRRCYLLALPVGQHAPLGRLAVYENKAEMLMETSADHRDGTALFETNGFYHEIASFIDQLRAGRAETDGSMASAVEPVAVAEAVRLRRVCYTEEARADATR